MEIADGVKAVDDAVRQQMREEIGDQELQQNEKFAMLQKYGILTPRRHLRTDGMAVPGLDDRIDTPEWASNRVEGSTWTRIQMWKSWIRQAKKSR